MAAQFIQLAYLAAAALFIVGLKKLGSPTTARRGNLYAALGMVVAIVATLLKPDEVSASRLMTVFGAVVAGAAIGLILAQTVKMTAMPQMVALLNGFGGAASALVSAAVFCQHQNESGSNYSIDTALAIQLGVIVGALTFAGSVIAFGKLQELISGRPLTYPLQKTCNFLLLCFIVYAATRLVYSAEHVELFSLLLIASLALGVLFVLPIGGADMPVVISLLNSFSGVAAAISGFVITNNALIISGALVGASGLILTRIMCKAMNRPLSNVLFGAFGSTKAKKGAGGDEDRTVVEISHDDAAMLMGYARLVIIVPGYGLAVAQAQHQVRELATLLENRGVEVKFAIHPVAGRMPGHMNVLLAEADVPYSQLYDMDQINPEFDRASVALVVGANDVVNPAARSDASSPIYGMPILDVDHAEHVIVMKRSMNPGFAGIQNDLFFDSKTRMLFGDAKSSLATLVQEIDGI